LLAKSPYTQQQPTGHEGGCVFVSAVDVHLVLVVEQTTSLDFDLLLKAAKSSNETTNNQSFKVKKL
jgi:hypothetical protein